MARGLADFDAEALQRFRAAALRRDGSGRGLSAADLAAMTDSTKAQILAYEQGRQTPEPPRIRALARALDIHPLMLARRSAYEMPLADLRRACGFCAREVVEMLYVSPKVYRRFELDGLAPARRPTLIHEVAHVLSISPDQVDGALLRSPRVRARLDEVGEVLQRIRQLHVVDPQPWKVPKASDPLMQQLALLLARSPSSVARLMAYVLGTERNRVLRLDRESLSAVYELHPERRSSALRSIERGRHQYMREMARLPQKLDRFFRYALPMSGWTAMTRIGGVDQWQPTAKLGIAYETLKTLPPGFVSLRVDGGRVEMQLNKAGFLHLRMFKDWYMALYPNAVTTEPPLDAQRLVTLRAVQATRETPLQTLAETLTVPVEDWAAAPAPSSRTRRRGPDAAPTADRPPGTAGFPRRGQG